MDGRTDRQMDRPKPICPLNFSKAWGIKRDRQKKRWQDNIKEWTVMDFASSTRVAKNRTKWQGIVANSSVVPRRPSKVMG